MRLNASNRTLALAAGLLVALVLVYANHFNNGFHFDDSHTILSNSYIRDIGNVPLFFQDARTTSTLPPNQAYRPMVTTLNAIDVWLDDALRPITFHRHIFLEFIVLLVCLYMLFIQLFEKADGNQHPLVALLGTAVFAFHAATAETINYIIARSDGFSTLMIVLGMLLYVSCSGWKKLWGLIPFIVACLTKPTGLMLAPLILTYELLLGERSPQSQPSKSWLSLLKWSVPYFVVGMVLYFFTQSMASPTWVRNTVSSPIEYLNTQVYVIALYVKTFFLPNHLSADPDVELIRELFAPKVILGATVILALLVIAFTAARKRITAPISYGILWFFIALIPSSSIVPLADMMNHHRTFFPYIGLVMAGSWSVFLAYQWATEKLNSPRLGKAMLVAVALFIVVNAYGTYERNEVWHNEETLWEDVAQKSPKNGRGLMAYGMVLFGKNEPGRALRYLEMASKTSFGTHPYLVSNLAKCHAKLGHDTLAKHYFELSLTGGDFFPECYYHYAVWLAEKGDLLGSQQQLSRLLTIAPSHQDGLAAMRKLEDELKRRQQLRALIETSQKYVQLSLQAYNLKKFDECIVQCQKAIEIWPKNADAYNNMCSAYNNLRQYDKAIAACEMAISIKPDHERALNNLNWAKEHHTK
jgi:Tfp pilus assembly protein PilF